MPGPQTLTYSDKKRAWRSSGEVTVPLPLDRYTIGNDQAGWHSEGRGGFRHRIGDLMSASRENAATLPIGVPAGISVRSSPPYGPGLRTKGQFVPLHELRRTPNSKSYVSGGGSGYDPADTWSYRFIVPAEVIEGLREDLTAGGLQQAIAKATFKLGHIYSFAQPIPQTESKSTGEPSDTVANWKSALMRASLFADEATQAPESTEFTLRSPRGHDTVDERRALFNNLYRSFETEPFENGIGHPAEQIIENALADTRTLDWFTEFCTDESESGFAASVLRCLGREPDAGHRSWRHELIRTALESPDIEIRDAAVQAAESWGGEEIIGILKSHQEPETWIREYIEDVIEDLGA